MVTQNISDPIDLSHNIVGIDGDGDQVSSTLDATLYPSAKSIEDTAGSDSLLNGTAGVDYIFGYDGADTLTGLSGDDILVGGSGNDTFKWQAGETGTDIIADWSTGSDILDLSELLQGETIATLDYFLDFSYNASPSKTMLTIDVDGSGSGTDEQIIVFEGVNLPLLGNDQVIIDNLLTNNQLITD